MAKIQLKRLTSTDIDNAVTVLADGEPCLAKDTDGKAYIVFGDGSTQLKDLKREPIGDAASVAIDDLTIVENSNSKLEVQLSDDADNAIEVKTDGLYVETVDQVKVATKADLPATGKENTIYIVSDEQHIYYWDGTQYVQLTQDLAGLVYKGSKDTTADLPASGNKNGDFWWIVDEDLFKIYNGTGWDTINLPANVQPDMASTDTTSMTFIKNKSAKYVAYVPLTTGGTVTATDVQGAIESLDKNKQDKVPTAKENNYAAWDAKGQTKDSGDTKTTTIAPVDSASDNKLPTEKAIATMKAEIDDKLNQQPTSNAADQGDVAILPLVSNADTAYTLRPVSATEGDFKDEYVGGYLFAGAQKTVLNRMFNRLKLFIVTPGWVRVGIVRGTPSDEGDGVLRGVFRGQTSTTGPLYNSTDTYPKSLVNGADDTTADGQSHTMLKKWLVVQWVATPGLHTFDIPDEVISSPFEYLFIEARMGVSGWALNRTTAALTSGGLSIPANTSVNGTAWPTTFLSATNFNSGSYAVSNNMLDASARPAYSSGDGAQGLIYTGWGNIDSASTPPSSFRNISGEGATWLNLGVYQRGSSGTTTIFPLVENATTKSSIYNNINSCLAGYGPKYEEQQILAEKGLAIYGLQLTVITPGDLSFYVFSSNDPATAKIVRHFTLRLRAVGPQYIHLPEEVILQKGQWAGVHGLTEATTRALPVASVVGTATVNKGYVDDAVFAHNIPAVSNWTQKGDDPTGVQTLVPYSSATGVKQLSGFQYWSGVKYVAGAAAGEGKVDFTTAKVNESTGYLNVTFLCRERTNNKLEDLNYSVTGDSISTYAGQISQSNDYGVTTNAAGNNAVFYPNSGSGQTASIDTTWWGILGKQARMRLIKNDAWSGSKVSGTDSATNSTACASQIRTKMLNSGSATYAANTTTGLGTNFGMPNVVFCMIGTNDLSGNVAAGAWSNTAPTDISTIIGAFETMVARHRTQYPATRFVYFLIPRGNQTPYPYTNGNALSIAQLADAFEYTAKNLGAYFVPLNYFHLLFKNKTNLWTMTSGGWSPRTGLTLGTVAVDWLHPTAMGHQIIADGLQRYCEENF